MPQRPVWDREDSSARELKRQAIEKLKSLDVRNNDRGWQTLLGIADLLDIPFDQPAKLRVFDASSGAFALTLSNTATENAEADQEPADIIPKVLLEMERREIPAIQMARELGVSRQQVSHWLRGRDNIGKKTRNRFTIWLERSRQLAPGQPWEK